MIDARFCLRHFLLTGLVVAAAALAGAPLQAQNQVVNISEGQRTGKVVVAAGKSETLRVTEPFENIVVGNPDVADVAPLTDRTLYVLGRAIGTTNIALYNEARDLIAVIDVEVSFDLSGMREALASALPGGQIRVRTISGRIMLEGTVPDAVALDKALTIAQDFAGETGVTNALTVASPQQVMLEVRVLEATRNLGRDLGIHWLIETQGFRFTTIPIDPEDGRLIRPPLASGGAQFGDIVANIMSGGVNIDILVQALEDKGVARRLAEPNLVALSGQPAMFHAGGEFPVPVVSEDGTENVLFKPFGVRLLFTPTVLADGVINLLIEPEVSEIDNSVVVRGIPGVTTRRAKTMVELRNGQSMAMAGLLQNTSSRSASQIPWIGDIPILGALFRSQGFQKRETELVVIVTPRLVAPVPPGIELATPLDNTRPSNDAELVLLGELEVTEEFMHLVETGGSVRGPFGHMLDLPKGKQHAFTK